MPRVGPIVILPEGQVETVPADSNVVKRYKRLDLTDVKINPLVSEYRCKICRSENRKLIDMAIYRQRHKDLNDDDQPFTLPYLLRVMAMLGVPNPNHENVTAHWRRHCEIPSAGRNDFDPENYEEILSKLSSQELLAMPRQDLLDLMMRQGIAEAGTRLRNSGKSGITIDQVLKIAELQIREKGSEAQNEFLKALGGGIASAFKHGLPNSLSKQIGEGEVVDADVVEVQEAEELVA